MVQKPKGAYAATCKRSKVLAMSDFDALDWVNVFEALYAVEQSRSAWLSGVLRAASPLLNRGDGVGGVLYRATKTGTLSLQDIQGLDIDSTWLAAGANMHTHE